MNAVRPDYSQLYVLGDPFSNRYMRLTVQRDARYIEADYDAFEGLVRAVFRGDPWTKPPLKLTHLKGGQPADFVWTDYPPITVISQRMVDLFSEHRFTGWTTYPVEIYDKKGSRLSNYHGLAITGRAGGEDYRRGSVIDKPPIVPNGAPFQVLRGFYFENDYWDGSDFCITSGYLPIIVTKRVVKVLTEIKVGNIEFTNLLEREIDVSSLKIAGVWPPERGF